MPEIALRARNSLDVSQSEFAELLGCPRQSVSRWERGKRNPGRVAQALFALLVDDPERSRRVLARLRLKRLEVELERLRRIV